MDRRSCLEFLEIAIKLRVDLSGPLQQGVDDLVLLSFEDLVDFCELGFGLLIQCRLGGRCGASVLARDQTSLYAQRYRQNGAHTDVWKALNSSSFDLLYSSISLDASAWASLSF